MWKAVVAGLLAVVAAAPGAAAGGEVVIEKLAPTTKIRMVTRSVPSYELTGRIEEGAQDVFKQVVGSHVGGVLRLESIGGDVGAAVSIGRLVRERRIGTAVVSGKCLSACAIIWAAGVWRYKGASASIGFHHPWHLENGRIVKGAGDIVTTYFRDLGYSDKVIGKFLADPNSFYYLTRDQAKELGVGMYQLD